MNANVHALRSARLACLAAATVWLASVAFAGVALHRAARHEAARTRHLALLKQLEPELMTLNGYRDAMDQLKAQPANSSTEPDFAAFLSASFPALRPDGAEAREDVLPASGLRRVTTTATWNAVSAETLAAIMEAAETSFRLSAITLAPSGPSDRRTFKAEAAFIAFCR